MTVTPALGTLAPVQNPAEDRATTAPARPRRRSGPVLIGDILMSVSGRPLLLTHWDRDDD